MGETTIRQPRASRINRSAAKSRCARQWGAWGRLIVDGPGHNNLDQSEGPWGRAAEAARAEVHTESHKNVHMLVRAGGRNRYLCLWGSSGDITEKIR